MLGHRPMGFDDYMAVLGRRKWPIVISVLLGPVVGYGVARLLPSTWVSEATVVVERPQVPDSYVKPSLDEDLTQRITDMEGQVLSRARLTSLIERFDLYEDERPITDEVIDAMRKDTTITIVQDFASLAQQKQTFMEKITGLLKSSGQQTKPQTPPYRDPRKPPPTAGFIVDFTGKKPELAQRVCGEIVTMFINEEVKQGQLAVERTTQFLSAQVSEAKRKLDEQDAKLAEFKRHYFGALPDEQQSNEQLISSLNSQLYAATDQLNRALQDKTYVESMLAELSPSKGSEDKLLDKSVDVDTVTSTLQQELAKKLELLSTYEARYTDENPDVIRLKSDIAQLRKTIDEQSTGREIKPSGITAISAGPSSEVLKLRAQLQQDVEAIKMKTDEQEHLEARLQLLESRQQLSPVVEEQYKELTRDYKAALDFYNDLLNKQNQSGMSTDLELRQQGEHFQLLDLPTLPDEATFPDRKLFALGGTGIGLMVGLCLALIFELRDKALRTESDIQALLDLPVLTTVPVLGNDKRGARRWARKAQGPVKQPVGIGVVSDG